MMRKVSVERVEGRQVLAGGTWLTAIGNKNINPGDAVWTDGRCVYGNLQEGGGEVPVVSQPEPFVPIFLSNGTHSLYHNGKLDKGWKDTWHYLMASRGEKFDFIDNRALDASLDADGKMQTLIKEEYDIAYGNMGSSFYDYMDERGVKVGIYFDTGGWEYHLHNGIAVGREGLDFAAPLEEGAGLCGEYALEMLAEAVGEPDAESETVLYRTLCDIAAGWRDSDNAYCLFLTARARAVYMTGNNLAVSNDARQCWEADYGTFQDIQVECRMDMACTPAGIVPLRGRYNNNRDTNFTDLPVERCYHTNFTKEAALPLPDGFKLMINQSKEAYSYALASPQGQNVCQLEEYKLGDRLLACKLGPKKWLVACGDKLYTARGGQKKLLDVKHSHSNSRLRPMKNYRKWMKGENADGTS